jgi:glycosyltransferase involved in cell wall biosynthesis
MAVRCDLVLPCRNEAAALSDLLARVPDAFGVIVVDNRSGDGTADVAHRLGARVVFQPVVGYGAAVQAGIEAATAPYVAVMDGDGSLDPEDLTALLDDVERGHATLAIGRRRSIAPGVWPWHARLGNAALLAWLRRRGSVHVRDISPMRVCRRDDLIELGIVDRGSGYPVELLLRAGAAGWSIAEHDVGYGPRAAGTCSKVSGSVSGTLRAARDVARVLS